jgi:pimeloyl-ACP methyl ester carboxylesterase
MDIKTSAYSCPLDHHGASLFIKGWTKEGSIPPCPPLILIQDLGQTPDSYETLALNLAERGIPTYLYDLRGHGPYSLPQGQIPSIPILGLDLLQVAAWVSHLHSGQKPVILAHGFSGAICLNFAKFYPIWCSKLIFLAPDFKSVEGFGPVKRLLLRALSRGFPKNPPPMFLSPFAKKNLIPLTNHSTWELLKSLSKTGKYLVRLNHPTLFLCPADSAKDLERFLSKNKSQEPFKIEILEMSQELILGTDPKSLGSIVQWTLGDGL